MINFIKGCSIQKADELKEEFKIEDNRIVANVNAEKIKNIIFDFIDSQDEEAPLFFFLEVPCNLDEEEIIREATDKEVGILKTKRRKVYYLDDISHQMAKEIINLAGDVLINDGFAAFGIGNHITNDEIGKDSYNIVNIFYYSNVDKYLKLLEKNGIVLNDNMREAGDIIGPENPGICSIYKDDDGRDIYFVEKFFKENFEGFYEAEIRDEE